MRIPLSIGLLLIVLAGPASAEWSWLHPQPQGHDLHDIVFLDNQTAIAVGELGTVLVTHDAGDTWVVKTKINGITTTLTRVERLDASTAVAGGKGGLILRTTDQGATWAPVPSGTTDDVRDISFFDASHGIAVARMGFSSSVALRSSDGGLTWQSTMAPNGLTAVDMLSATEAVGAGAWATIMRTTDGGATWSTAPAPADGISEVDFLDPLHGAIASTNGVDESGGASPSRCYVTADGGNTWTSSNLFGGITIREFHPGELLYPQTGQVLVAGRVCCWFGAYEPPPTGHFVSTIDAGGSWTSTAVNRPANGLARNHDGVVIVVGDDGRMIRRNLDSTFTRFGPDQDASWAAADRSSFLDSQVGVIFSSDGTDYMYGSYRTHFSRTNDGGQTWANSIVDPVQCVDVACLSATEMIAVGIHGSQGAVLRSTNGGTAWPQLWTGASPSVLHAVAAGSSSMAIAVGTGGTALIIDNGVVTPVATGGTNFRGIAFATSSVVVAVGGTDARSLDGGQTWAPIVGPSTGIYALDFVSPTRAFGVDSGGIRQTDDIATNWTLIHTQSGLQDISFADASNGMAVGSNGVVLITTDGGTTWEPGDVPTTRRLNSVNMIAPDHAFVSGLDQIVFEYGQRPVPTLIRALDVTPKPFGADLRWEVTTDEYLSGFAIRRSSGSTAETIASGLSVTSRSFYDEGLVPGRTYEYQLLAVDRDGSYTQSAPVSVKIPAAMVELLPNQPNPFNPSTTIRFVVPEKTSVQLTVHDVAGRAVATLVDDTRAAGMHTIEWNAEGMASGVYFARLRAGKTELSRKMVLLK